MIAFDLVNEHSFKGVKQWLDSIYKHCDLNIPKVLIGNKCDLVDVRVVSEGEGRKIAEENSMQYYETSAKENYNVENVVNYLMNEVYEKKFKEKLENAR